MIRRVRRAGFFVCLLFVLSGAGAQEAGTGEAGAQEAGTGEAGAQEAGTGEAGAQEAPEVFFPPGTETPSRNAVPGTAGGGPVAAEGADGTAAAGVPLPRSYRETGLGMSLEDLKAGLARDEIINFRGDRDVSFLPSREQTLVETTGFSFIRRAFFQLRDGKVFIMAYALNTRLVDHYSVFTAFTEKYGEPVYLDPKQAVWENEDTRVAIERPLTVKYIDKTVFNDMVNESALIESAGIRRRQEFLDDF